MRTDRPGINSALLDALSLRGQQSFDVAPVIVVDDIRTGPYQPFAPFAVAGQSGVVAGKYPAVAITVLQGVAVVDLIRAGNANVNQNLWWGFFKFASVASDYTVPTMAAAMLRQGSPNVDNPMLGSVLQSVAAAGTPWGANELGTWSFNPGQSVPCNFTVVPGSILVVRGDSVGTTIHWAVEGRYYDAA